MVLILIFDIDDTLYIHKNNTLDYSTITEDLRMKQLLNNIVYPKYILTNATFSHANIIVNKLGILEQFEKIYSRDNIPVMKPHPHCYQSVYDDISHIQFGSDLSILFFDDLLENLKQSKKKGWSTIWISPKYESYEVYPFIDRAFPDLHTALETLNF